MRQLEALTIIASEGGEIWLGMPVRGQFSVWSRIADKTIPARTWEALLK